jgi:hypothetical protein
MSEQVSPQERSTNPAHPTANGVAAGFILFAVVMMIMIGLFQALAGVEFSARGQPLPVVLLILVANALAATNAAAWWASCLMVLTVAGYRLDDASGIPGPLANAQSRILRP